MIVTQYVCKKCSGTGNDKNTCFRCGYNNLIPIEYNTTYGRSEVRRLKEEIKKLPEYDAELDARLLREGERKRDEEIYRLRAEESAPKPKCPTCGSTNIKDISTLNRAVSVGLFGLASGKIGKTKECKNCGYKW